MAKFSRVCIAEINFHKSVIRELAAVTSATVEQIVEAVKRAEAAQPPSKDS